MPLIGAAFTFLPSNGAGTFTVVGALVCVVEPAALVAIASHRYSPGAVTSTELVVAPATGTPPTVH